MKAKGQHYTRLAELLWIPKKITEGWRDDVYDSLLDRLTIVPRGFGGKEVKPIITYVETKDELGVPVSFGLKLFQNKNTPISDAGWKEERSLGRRIKVPTVPVARDSIEGQKEFFENLVRKLLVEPAVLAKAPTGSGKTVAGAYAIAILSCTTLIVAPTELIADQWVATLCDICNIDQARVGMVGFGSKPDDWRNKDVVIGCINSVAMKEMPPEFYQEFGFVIFDEADTVAAATFSNATKKINALYRLGMSATLERRDGTTKVLTDYFGPIAVEMAAKPQYIEVWVTRYQRAIWGRVKPEKMPRSIMLNIISKDMDRNAMLTRILLKGYQRGRNGIALSDRIDQLGLIHRMLVDVGVKEEDIGYLAGDKFENRIRVKTRKEDDEFAKEKAKVILATYARAKRGVNITRLDFGVELTPVGDADQAVGRILRPDASKKQPSWFTVIDIGVPDFERSSRYRINGLRERVGAKIIEV